MAVHNRHLSNLIRIHYGLIYKYIFLLDFNNGIQMCTLQNIGTFKKYIVLNHVRNLSCASLIYFLNISTCNTSLIDTINIPYTYNCLQMPLTAAEKQKQNIESD